MDQIHIKDLVVRGIIGINPDERVNQQDILVNVTLWADTTRAARTDDIDDAVNYKTITKRIIAHIDAGEPMLVERLVQEIADICLDDERVSQGRGHGGEARGTAVCSIGGNHHHPIAR